MNANEIRLITIPISHYCEKARWALEWSVIPYREERHLQGFHYWPVYRAAKTDSVPVLITPEGVFSDSTDILRWSDSKAPKDRKLLPDNPKQREEIEKFEDYLDEELGVAGRLWMYTHMLNVFPVILRYSKRHGLPPYEVRTLALTFPFLKRWLNRVLHLTPNSRADSQARVLKVFQEIEGMLADGRPYLFGEHFTAADLTFAALSASVLIPGNYGAELPKLGELPKEMKEQVDVWRNSAAGKFALRMIRDHRHGASALRP